MDVTTLRDDLCSSGQILEFGSVKKSTDIYVGFG